MCNDLDDSQTQRMKDARRTKHVLQTPWHKAQNRPTIWSGCWSQKGDPRELTGAGSSSTSWSEPRLDRCVLFCENAWNWNLMTCAFLCIESIFQLKIFKKSQFCSWQVFIANCPGSEGIPVFFSLRRQCHRVRLINQLHTGVSGRFHSERVSQICISWCNFTLSQFHWTVFKAKTVWNL